MKINFERSTLIALLTGLGELTAVTSEVLAHLDDIVNNDELKDKFLDRMSYVAASCALVQGQLGLDAELMLSNSVDMYNALVQIEQQLLNSLENTHK